MNVKDRVRRVFANHQDPLDAIIIKNGTENFLDVNFFYLSGLFHGLFESSTLIMFPDGSTHIITTNLEKDIADESDAYIHIYESTQTLGTILEDIVKHTKHIGFHGSGLLFREYQWLTKLLSKKTFHDVTKALQQTRMIKDHQEIDVIKKACDISDRVMSSIRSLVTKNMSEDELASEIDYHLQRYGAQNPAFETISSFGAHTAIPHYNHGAQILRRNDFVLCDFGACYQKYHSDMTRTFVFGSASKKQQQIHQTVRDAQKEAFDLIRPGIPASRVHHHVRSYIDGTEFKDCFIHSTGHSLGMSVHDPGVSLSSTCDVNLQENMVLTVEPGIYLPGLGGVRIEDDILVTSQGCELLTQCPRDGIEI
jgi:Xaa-Pro dipeptidase